MEIVDGKGRPVPTVSGWYWARHKIFGWVITHLLILDGKAYVQDRGPTGWNDLIDQFEEWDKDPIPNRQG
ncbi:hypothetical protein [Pseudomonas putida]|uniref:Uncharacterized protein n=1 Tax=Pseudomonas putida TaxID=303 RepID=A0A8I1JGD7_PSEPU|nr:hypothetical protein [Pseudomonas putida]MBI6882712.1 hypothetical protein [Pseudomonas putida]